MTRLHIRARFLLAVSTVLLVLDSVIMHVSICNHKLVRRINTSVARELGVSELVKQTRKEWGDE